MDRKKTGKTAVKAGGVAVLEKPQDMTGHVRETAYSLFEKRGYAHGNDWHDWFEAEKIVYDRNKGK